jgi:hypothetical protein
MRERPGAGDVLCSAVSDARFLVVDPGTAVSMPCLDGMRLFRGKPHPCSMAACSAADCELQGGQCYVDPVTGLTLLCIWPGRGTLHYDGRRVMSLTRR